MAGVQRLDFDSPDETRTPEKTRVDLVRVGNTTIGRFAFESGWRWSECIKPVVGTDSCQARHVGIVRSGSTHVVHDDGTEADLEAGDAYVIEPRPRCMDHQRPAVRRVRVRVPLGRAVRAGVALARRPSRGGGVRVEARRLAASCGCGRWRACAWRRWEPHPSSARVPAQCAGPMRG
jgi:hypothetical protein